VGAVHSKLRNSTAVGPGPSAILCRLAALALMEAGLAWVIARGLIALAGRLSPGLTPTHSSMAMPGMTQGVATRTGWDKIATVSSWVAVATCISGCLLVAFLRRTVQRSPERTSHAKEVGAIGAGTCLLAALWPATGPIFMSSHLIMMASLMLVMGVAPALTVQAVYPSGREPRVRGSRHVGLVAATGYTVLVACWHVPSLMDSLGRHAAIRLLALVVGFACGVVLWAVLLDTSSTAHRAGRPPLSPVSRPDSSD
jgi:hypothetical protein